MPRQLTEDTVWKERLKDSNKYYESWEKLFSCNVLEEYYEGRQWTDSDSELRSRNYVINKVYETIQIKLDQFIPTNPQFNISAKPGNSDFNQELAIQSAQLKQDVLNTITSDDFEHFQEELQLAYKDSFFRFGVVEVGYAADWVLNPNAPKPFLAKDAQSNPQNRGKKMAEPMELPLNERVYFKHIGAKRFRVGGIDHKYLNQCDWFGYFEWINKDDLMALPGIMNKDLVTTSQPTTPQYQTSDKDPNKYKGDAVKIWHIWDNRTKMRLLLLDSPCITLFQRKFSRIPICDFRPDRRLITEGFYPIPPVFHWISPQDEINEIREAMRNHRRRFTRKYMAVEGMVEDEEMQKFEDGPDGTVFKVKRLDAIKPVDNAAMGQENRDTLVTSADDLNRISAVSTESRGTSDRTTATQATIINNRSTGRENAEVERVARWVARMGRETLLIIRDKFTLGIWANLTSDPGEQLFGTVNENKTAYTWVTSEDLNDGYDFRIQVDVTSLSSVSQQEEKQKYFEFLAALTQFPAIAFSPKLVRETAYRCGYRNEAVIREMQQMALMQELGRQAQMKQAGVQLPEPGNAGQQIAQQQTPPDIEQIRQQLTTQLGQNVH